MSIKGLNMIGPHHVCVLYVATAGLQGSLMGSDEQEIVLLIYVIVDVVQNKVSAPREAPRVTAVYLEPVHNNVLLDCPYATRGWGPSAPCNKEPPTDKLISA
ncbi:hypothetical protein MTP99_000417 [Tenebrio molitor]|jgi:hypothetical protein|nr:hypothetical protein MTP99_000417 [Tenebrio molitor]